MWCYSLGRYRSRSIAQRGGSSDRCPPQKQVNSSRRVVSCSPSPSSARHAPPRTLAFPLCLLPATCRTETSSHNTCASHYHATPYQATHPASKPGLLPFYGSPADRVRAYGLQLPPRRRSEGPSTQI